jgi:hypothetical protein
MDRKDDVWEFEKLEQQLHSFLDEMSQLSRKKPNDPLNKFKLKFINAVLGKMSSLLGDFRPFEDFERFNVDDLPSNSDVVLILSQYAGAVLRLRTDLTVFNDQDREWYWIVRGKRSEIQTGRPGNFKYQPK